MTRLSHNNTAASSGAHSQASAVAVRACASALAFWRVISGVASSTRTAISQPTLISLGFDKPEVRHNVDTNNYAFRGSLSM